MSAEQPTTTPASTKATEEETHKVFIGNLSFSSTDESLKAYFKEAGQVLETIIIKKGSRPKGFGFVAFKTLEEAEKAVEIFDKKEFDGREISVQLAIQRSPEELEAAKNEKKKKQQQKRKSGSNKKSRKSASAAVTSEEDNNKEEEEKEETEQEDQQPAKPKTSVFVANLPLGIQKDDLAEIFKDYQVESALVAIQRSGRSKGYGFVELKSVEEMNKVLNEFVDVEVQGRPIHISAATSEKTGGERKKKPSTKAPKKAENNEVEEEGTAPVTAEGEKKKKKSSNRKRNNSKKNKEKEDVAAAHDAQEAVVELKQQDGIHAAHDAQEAVNELKEEDGVEAAKAANDAVEA